MTKKGDFMDNTQKIIHRTFLAGLNTGSSSAEFEHSMEELKELAKALDLEVVGIFTQNLPNPIAATYIGSGKIAEIKEQVKEYHKYYDVIHYGELYRLITPFENEFKVAWEFVSEDKKEALVTVVNIKLPYDNLFFLKLKGLDPEKIYEVEDSGETYSGAYLMNAGLNLTHKPNGDGISYLIHL